MSFARLTSKWRILKEPLNGKLNMHVKIIRTCAMLHNFVLDFDDDDDDDDDARKDGPVEMGYYPMRLDPNAPEDKEILDRFKSKAPGHSIVREAIKKIIELNDLRRPKYNLERNQKEVERNHEVNEYRVE